MRCLEVLSSLLANKDISWVYDVTRHYLDDDDDEVVREVNASNLAHGQTDIQSCRSNNFYLLHWATPTTRSAKELNRVFSTLNGLVR